MSGSALHCTALRGGCHCGDLGVELTLTQAPAAYTPRACDCSFCRAHGAAWLSDAAGSLRLIQRHAEAALRYRQGSGQAECLACARCAILLLVVCEIDGRWFGAVNARALVDAPPFAAVQPASPQQLSADAKRTRWQQLWFADVRFDLADDPTRDA